MQSDYKIQIFDLQGKLVYTTNYLMNQTGLEIDAKEMSNGNYVMQVVELSVKTQKIAQKIVMTQKIVVQK
jgi:Secretion system C-terminal sorting domain